MTHPLRSAPITGVSTLLRGGPSLTGASVFLPRGFRRLGVFPFHLRSSSQVPYERLNEIRASYTPDTAWPVSKLLPCTCQGRNERGSSAYLVIPPNSDRLPKADADSTEVEARCYSLRVRQFGSMRVLRSLLPFFHQKRGRTTFTVLRQGRKYRHPSRCLNR